MKIPNLKEHHYAWKIMIACIFIKLGTGGVVFASMGNFVAPIVKELGCQVSELTLFISIEAISMALLYTTASKILTTKRIGLVIGLASITEVIGIALMATYQSVQMFYISGLLIGVAQAFTSFVAIPIVVNMWFRKKTGTVLGIIVAVSSASAVGYGLLSAQLITTFGWRMAYLILASMAAVITLPAVFLLIKSPSEVGCEPYGADESEMCGSQSETGSSSASLESGLTRSQAFRMPLLYIAWIACIMYSYGSGVAGYITPFATMELGQTINFGAYAGMFMSFGAILCSLILGRINDTYGVRAGLLWGAVTTTIGYVVMLLSLNNPILVLPAAFAVGLGSSMYMVQCPLLVLKVVGAKNYPEIWSIMMMANSMIGGGLYSSIGLFYDKLGSYKAAFIMCIALYIGGLVFGSLSIALNHKRSAQTIELQS